LAAHRSRTAVNGSVRYAEVRRPLIGVSADPQRLPGGPPAGGHR